MHKNQICTYLRQKHIILNRRRIVELKLCTHADVSQEATASHPEPCWQLARAFFSYIQVGKAVFRCMMQQILASPSRHVADIPGDLNRPRMIPTTGARGAGSTATLPKCKVITHATGHKTATRTYKMPLICRRQLQQNQVPATVTAVAFLCLQTRRTSMTCHLEGQAPTSFLPQLFITAL